MCSRMEGSMRLGRMILTCTTSLGLTPYLREKLVERLKQLEAESRR